MGSRVVTVALLMAALVGCSGGGDSATSTKPTSQPAPSTSGCPRFRGVTTKLESVGATSPGFLIDATAGTAGCLDQVTFTFDTGTADTGTAPGTPGYVVQYRDPAQEPFLDGDPPVPIDVPGQAFLVVTMKPALSTNPLIEGRPQTYTGNLSLAYGDHHHLQIVRKLPDGSNTVEWVIGLDGRRPFLVDRAENPARITVYIG
ncbi:MAG: hypothetical protein ACHQDE_04645 [Acidimicrobiia bacterium]